MVAAASPHVLDLSGSELNEHSSSDIFLHSRGIRGFHARADLRWPHYFKVKHPDPTLSNFIEMETAKGNKCWFQRRHLVLLVLALHFSALWRYTEDPAKSISAFPPSSLHPGKPSRLEV